MDERTARVPRAVLTVPNGVTLVRLALVPVFVVLVAQRSDRYAAAIFLAVLGGTDWLDGYLARRLDQVSTVGKVLDPVVDRVLLLTAVGAIVAVGAAPLGVALGALIREALIAFGGVAVALAGARRIDVTGAGKAGTFGLMCAFPLFLVGHSTAGWHTPAEVLAWCCAIPGLIFAWWAALAYVPRATQAVAEGRAGRGPERARAQEVGR